MRHRLTAVAALLLLVGTGSALAAQEAEPDRIEPAEAAEHDGDEVTVCGDVAGTAYVGSQPGRPSFLSFGGNYPNQAFSVVVFAEDAENFRRRPDRLYRDKYVCVTGTVEMFDGKPRMVITTPEAIEITEPQ
jgi:hypothetical protein